MAATHCKRGHPWDEANTYVSPKGQRSCRVCRRASQAGYYSRGSRACRLSPAPLLARQGDRNDTVFAETIGVSRRTVLRWRTGTVTLHRATADRCATALGLGIGDLWPEAA